MQNKLKPIIQPTKDELVFSVFNKIIDSLIISNNEITESFRNYILKN